MMGKQLEGRAVIDAHANNLLGGRLRVFGSKARMWRLGSVEGDRRCQALGRLEAVCMLSVGWHLHWPILHRFYDPSCIPVSRAAWLGEGAATGRKSAAQPIGGEGLGSGGQRVDGGERVLPHPLGASGKLINQGVLQWVIILEASPRDRSRLRTSCTTTRRNDPRRGWASRPSITSTRRRGIESGLI